MKAPCLLGLLLPWLFWLASVSSQPDSTALIVGRPFKLNIASIFVRQRDLTVYYEIAKPAIDLAVEECNKKYKNFIDVSVIVRNDSELCTSTYAPSLAGEEYYLKNAMAFVGPACLYSLDIVGRLAAFWNVPIFTAGGSSVEFNDKTLFSTLTRLSYSLDRISDFLLQTLREFEWKHLAFIVDDSDLTMLSVDKTFKENIKEERSLRDYDIQYTTQYFTYALNATINYTKLLIEASQEARVFILLVKGQTLREIMLAAYDLGMHTKGEYTFIGIELIKAKKVDAIEWYKFGDRRNKEAKIIFESLIIFTVKIPVSNAYKNFVYEVSKRARNEFKSDFTIEDVNQNVAGFYDALLIYCLVLNETIGDGDNPFDGRQITRRIWGRTFSNIDTISGDILVNANGDRETDYTLDDLDPETGQFRSVYNYYGAKRKIEKVPGVAMHWPNKENKPVKDVPDCGFKNDKPECLRKSDSTLLIVILVIVLVLVLALCFTSYRVYVKLKYENQLNDYWWKIHWEDIQFADRANIRNKSVSSIGKSETSFKTQTQSFTGKTSVLSSMATTLANVDSAILCGHYKGVKVAVKPINVPKLNITRENLVEFKQMRDVIHNNLVNFVGMVSEETNTAIVSELCVRGSLKDMLENEKITIDWMFKCSMINDIIEGMIYLHNSPIEFHGHLKSTNLVVDSRFNVAICDYGLRSVYSQVKTNEDDFNPRCLFWTAPEHLRERFPTKSGSQKGDVYSFAIILQEIICRTGPWENLPSSHKHLLNEPEELLDRIKAGTVPPFRPEIQAEDVEAPEILPILSLSWCENPMIRPSFPELKVKLKKITRGITSSKLLDNLMKRIETYSSNLEKIVQEKTESIVVEKARAEELLNNILPQFIVEQLKSGIAIQAQSFPSVTLMFTNIEGFMELSKESTPQQIVNMLNDIYDLMDTCLANHDVYKLESINDAYLWKKVLQRHRNGKFCNQATDCRESNSYTNNNTFYLRSHAYLVASGVPVKNASEHVREIAYCALDARDAFETFRARHRPAHKFKIRIGFHSGSVVAGVIGLKMPKYCVFGDTINTASRMQTNSEPGKIHISSKSKDLLDLFGDFVILPRGEVQIKGKGSMKTFWLDSATKKKEKKKRAGKQASSETATLASMEASQANIEKQKSMEANQAKADANPGGQKEANNPSTDKPNPTRQNSEPKKAAPAPDKAKN